MRLKCFFYLFVVPVAVSACLARGGGGGCSSARTASKCRCDQASKDAGVDYEALPESPVKGGIVRIRISKEPQSLLSMVDSDPWVRSIVDHDVYEALVRTSEDGERVEPELAAAWIEDAEGGEFTFHLDPAARWHDGRPVTAKDVEFTFSKLLDPDGQAALRAEFADVEEVEVIDDHTVIVRLDRPRPLFLFSLSEVSILPAHIFGRVPLAGHPAARAPVGSGPLKFVRWVPGKLIQLEKRKCWRGKELSIDGIEYRIIPDNRVALDLFRRGDLDIVLDLPGTTERVGAKSRLITYPLPQFEAWIYNTERPVFKSANTRRAVGMLIDRKAIRCSILRCRADLVDGPWPPERIAPGRSLAFDPIEAGKLLEQEGWVDRDGDGIRERGSLGFSFFLLLPDVGRDLERIAAVVQGDLAMAGIEMRIATVNLGTYLRRLKSSRFDASVIAFRNRGMFDPWSLFHSRAIGGGENFGAFRDPETDRLLDQMRVEIVSSARADIMRLLNLRLWLEHPVTFTFRPHTAVMVRNDVRGVKIRDGWFDERLLRRIGDPHMADPGMNR